MSSKLGNFERSQFDDVICNYVTKMHKLCWHIKHEILLHWFQNSYRVIQIWFYARYKIFVGACLSNSWVTMETMDLLFQTISTYNSHSTCTLPDIRYVLLLLVPLCNYIISGHISGHSFIGDLNKKLVCWILYQLRLLSNALTHYWDILQPPLTAP